MHTSLLARINVKILNNPHIDWLNSCEQKIYCVCYCCFFLTDGISDELAERVISVLFEMWLTACSASFPVPSLWRTFRDMCSNWRHHEAVIIQWNRVNYALTAPLLVKLYGPDHPELVVSKSISAATAKLNNSAYLASALQTWSHIMSGFCMLNLKAAFWYSCSRRLADVLDTERTHTHGIVLQAS